MINDRLHPKRHMVVSSSDMASQRKKHSWLSPIGQWRRTGWGANDDVEKAMQSVICVIKRGGDVGREVAIQQTAGAREMVAQ